MFFYRKKGKKSHSKSNKNRMTVIASNNPKWKPKKHYGLTEFEFKQLCDSIEVNKTVKHIKIKEEYCYAY